MQPPDVNKRMHDKDYVTLSSGCDAYSCETRVKGWRVVASFYMDFGVGCWAWYKELRYQKSGFDMVWDFWGQHG